MFYLDGTGILNGRFYQALNHNAPTLQVWKAGILFP